MSADALSTKQFNTEHALLSQGNTDELAARVRGIQNMTSNVYRPSFSADYTTVHSMPSGTADGRPTAGGVMEGEDEEE
jgi:hypothetical protein